MSEGSTRRTAEPRRWRDAICAALIVAAGIALLAPGLAHPFIFNWDESVHQAAARGTYETFLEPHVYAHALYPERPGDWLHSGPWLHKPPLPFWLAALAMHMTGVSPVDLRLVSLLGEIAAALGLFLLARRAAGRLAALLAALSFLALPFGWTLVQGYQFGDATDCLLGGAVAVAMLLLVTSIEKESSWLAVAAGAMTGGGLPHQEWARARAGRGGADALGAGAMAMDEGAFGRGPRGVLRRAGRRGAPVEPPCGARVAGGVRLGVEAQPAPLDGRRHRELDRAD